MIAWLRSKFHAAPVYCGNCTVARATTTSYDETPLCDECAVELALLISEKAHRKAYVKQHFASTIKSRGR